MSKDKDGEFEEKVINGGIILGEHREHSLEPVGTNERHKWIQRGVNVECDGMGDHPRHGFSVPPNLVLEETRANGDLVFRDVNRPGKEGEVVMAMKR